MAITTLCLAAGGALALVLLDAVEIGWDPSNANHNNVLRLIVFGTSFNAMLLWRLWLNRGAERA